MTPQPWYKQFWPWFLIILPCCAVVASVYTYFIAANTPFAMVSEDYYKEGKGINQDLSRIRTAQNLGLRFSLDLEDNAILIRQQGGEPINGAIEVEFHHVTLGDRDFTQMLTRDGHGAYRLPFEGSLAGTWMVQIDAYDQRWRLQSRVTLPNDDTFWFQ